MVLFQSQSGVCLYGRVGLILSDIVGIFSSPLETSEEFVRSGLILSFFLFFFFLFLTRPKKKTDLVVPFTSGMRRMSHDVREAQLLVIDPINDFYSVMGDEILTSTYEYLLDDGLDLRMIKRCVVDSANVKQLIALKRFSFLLFLVFVGC